MTGEPPRSSMRAVAALSSLRTYLSIALLLVGGCGARTGLDWPEGGRVDGGLDGGLDGGRPDGAVDGGRRDTSVPIDAFDAGVGCPFDFDETVTATLLLSTDDQARVFLHGALLDDVARVWSDVARYEIPLFRHPAHPNVIAVEGTNVFRIDGRDRGVLADLRVTTEAGLQILVTDERWRLSAAMEPGFFEVDHDDSGWRVPTLEGRHPIAPWGAIFGSSEAAWLWSYDSNRAAATKPEGEVIFLRRRFFFDLAGRIVLEPTPCP